MKKLLMLIFVFSFMSMNIAYAMDIHIDVASGDDLQISQSFDMTPDSDDTPNNDVQCQIHCCHAGGHALFFEIASHNFNLPASNFSLSDPGMYHSLDHEPPFQPPIA